MSASDTSSIADRSPPETHGPRAAAAAARRDAEAPARRTADHIAAVRFFSFAAGAHDPRAPLSVCPTGLMARFSEDRRCYTYDDFVEFVVVDVVVVE